MHFYSKDGEPRHWVPMAKDATKMRPTRTADAKKNGWVPSVTTILNTLDKPALVDWKVRQHLETAYDVDGSGMELSDYIAEVKRLTELRMDAAPSAGTDIHDILERWMLGEKVTERPDIIKNVSDAIKEHAGTTALIPEVRFASPAGFAGMADIFMPDSAAYDLRAPGGMSEFDPGWVIDYKTKMTADKFKPGKMAYADHARQLAAYRNGLGVPDARCANLFICIETGEVDFHEHAQSSLDRGWGTFLDCLSIWQRENYDSSFSKEEA